MADKKYTGPERRGQEQTRRFRERHSDSYAGRTQAMMPTAAEDYRSQSNMMLAPEEHRGNANQSIMQIKEDETPTSRRHGPGRRSGDLARALKTGESVTYQFGKGNWKSKGALAKKVLGRAGRVGKLALAAVSLYDLVNRAKQ